MITFKTFLEAAEEHRAFIDARIKAVDDLAAGVKKNSRIKPFTGSELEHEFRQFLYDMKKTVHCEDMHFAAFQKMIYKDPSGNPIGTVLHADITFERLKTLSPIELELIQKAFIGRAVKYFGEHTKVGLVIYGGEMLNTPLKSVIKELQEHDEVLEQGKSLYVMITVHQLQ